MDLDTGAVQYRTGEAVVAVSPSWSPDSTRIAYVSRPDTGPVSPANPNPNAEAPRRIWIMDATPGAWEAWPVRTDGADCRQERPLWSGDGEQILFACLGTEGEVSLWLVPVTGGKATQVVARVSSGSVGGAPSRLLEYQGHVDWQQLYDWQRP